MYVRFESRFLFMFFLSSFSPLFTLDCLLAPSLSSLQVYTISNENSTWALMHAYVPAMHLDNMNNERKDDDTCNDCVSMIEKNRRGKF